MTRLVGQTSPEAHQHDPQRKRALSIFRYLRELARLKTSTVRDLNSYERVFWLSTLRDKKGCATRCFRPDPCDTLTLDRGGEEDADEWVTVRKFAEPSLPRPPTLIQRWLVPGSDKDPDSPPKLLDRVPRESARVASPTLPNSAPKAIETPGGAADAAIPADPDAAFDLLEDFPQVVEGLNAYVEREWKPWAAKHRVWRDFQQNVYAPLFGVHRDLQRLGEEFELVLGLGCLTWKTSSGQVVRRHLVTAQATVEFDPVDGVFTLRPGADGAKLALEIDMLEPSEQPTIAQLDVIRSDLAKAEDDPWDFEVMDRVLGGFAGALDEDSKYDPHEYSLGSVDHLPRVTFAPALLLRRRNSRGLLQAFETVIEQLSKGAEIPPGVKRLTAAAADDSASDGSPSSLKAGEFAPPERVYFPLPANEDQRQIVERLNSRYGVLVQGPPGTGKSHTIANLICHLLATGQRVLITAQTPRALQVLRGKLPPTVRPLCLSVLGNDKAAQDNVEHSVRNITDKADGWDEAAVRTEIGKTERELDRLLERETALERDVRVFREVEVHEHTVADGTYKGTAQAIAAHLRRDQARFNWFVDDVPVDGKPPVSSEELRAYWEGMTNIPPQRIAETEMLRPARGKDMPTGNKLLELVRDLKSLKERVQPVADGEIQLGTLPLADLRPAHTSLQTLRTAVQQIPSAATPWPAAGLTDVLREASGTWELLLADTRKTLSSLGERAAALDKGDIRLPANRRSDVLLADTGDLLAHLQRGGKLRRWLLFRPKVVRRTLYVVMEASVNGRPCATPETLHTIKEFLECTASVAKAWTLWDGKASPTTKTLCHQIGELNELAHVLARILDVTPIVKAAKTALACLNHPALPALHDIRAVGAFALRLDRVMVRGELQAVNSEIEQAVTTLRSLAANPKAHPVCGPLAEALSQRDEQALTDALAELKAIEDDAGRLTKWTELSLRLSETLPKLVKAIAANRSDGIWKARITEFPAAWRYAQADAWLRRYTDPRKAAATENELKQVKRRIADLLEHAASERAWNSCLTSMSRAHQQHLNAWRQAIKKIGKGTGKHAGHWRRVAQTELEQCRDAIPAWVMPLYRLFETVKPAPGIFDVVIVDEASQCGPESLILFYLAKKLIVVGDDKQISPSNVGIDRDEARSLLRQHLTGIDLADTFDVDSSLFDHGQVRLGKCLPLHEHFRCMPEIIRFSNDLCYNGSLIPLRQYPPKRLAPFVARFLSTGKREGGKNSAVNLAEAEAIIETIAACCQDPMYADRTMGVISLLGDHQGKLIERDLLRRIGAEEIDRRRIICGDAYSFQGDERHVIFLSMVVAPKDRSETGFSALTKMSDMQRFNVAASRAQDQLWLFHSVKPEDIGNHECMRHRLLSHFYDPARHAAKAFGIDLDELRRSADDPDRPEISPPPFDSWFEVDVYLRLTARGYRVLPQYKAGHHSIDLVVEGKSRLAIECDGDRWHGPDKFDEDMARQRQLERAGWRFWRVRGGVFYRDPDAALQPLWPVVAELGIEPMPALDGTGSSDGYAPCVPS